MVVVLWIINPLDTCSSLLLHSGAVEKIPKAMHGIASYALSRSFLKDVRIDAHSFRSFGDDIREELIKRCVDNPWDFPARARGKWCGLMDKSYETSGVWGPVDAEVCSRC